MANSPSRFGLGDDEPSDEEGALWSGINSPPHDDDTHLDQSWDPGRETLTSLSYTSSYKARKAAAHHFYSGYSLGPTTATQMADQHGYTRNPNDDEDHRDLANPDQGWNPDNDTLAFSAVSSGDGANDPNAGPYASEDEDADTVMEDDYSDLPPLVYGPPTSIPLPTQSPSMAQYPLPEPHYEVPFITLMHSQTIDSDSVLDPVLGLLVNLKVTTVPDYHPGLQTRSHEKVLAVRLEGIAGSIRERLKNLSETKRGKLELMLCRFIAETYWPLPVTPTTHLDIHRIYHNTLARQVPLDQLRAERARHEEWLETRPSGRLSFGAAAFGLRSTAESPPVTAQVDTGGDSSNSGITWMPVVTADEMNSRDQVPPPPQIEHTDEQLPPPGMTEAELTEFHKRQRLHRQIARNEALARTFRAGNQDSHNDGANTADDASTKAMMNLARAASLFDKMEKNKEADEKKLSKGDAGVHEQIIGGVNLKSLSPGSPGGNTDCDMDDLQLQQLKSDEEMARELEAQWQAEDRGRDAPVDDVPPIIFEPFDSVEQEKINRLLAQQMNQEEINERLRGTGLPGVRAIASSLERNEQSPHNDPARDSQAEEEDEEAFPYDKDAANQ